jgi:hypothetical protein
MKQVWIKELVIVHPLWSHLRVYLKLDMKFYIKRKKSNYYFDHVYYSKIKSFNQSSYTPLKERTKNHLNTTISNKILSTASRNKSPTTSLFHYRPSI